VRTTGRQPLYIRVLGNSLWTAFRRRSHAEKIRAFDRDAAVLYSRVFAQWGATDRALDSLETAMRLRSPYLEQLKTAALFDPIRKEPHFRR